jgi:hypothetical protein
MRAAPKFDCHFVPNHLQMNLPQKIGDDEAQIFNANFKQSVSATITLLLWAGAGGTPANRHSLQSWLES